jgi:GNAT superfamily N-acetyltransferase
MGDDMATQAITIVPFVSEHIAAIADLLHEQETRFFRQNNLLASPQAVQDIHATLSAHAHQGGLAVSFVALDMHRRVRGYVRPSIWPLLTDSILLSFLTARNGTTQFLTLPDHSEVDAHEIVDALFSVLDTSWHEAGTTGDLLRWPSTDLWFDEVLVRHAFRLDSICAYRPLQPPFSVRGLLPERYILRLAQPGDESELVTLFHEELRFHEQYTPFVHTSPSVLHAFQRKLQRSWQRERPQMGEPFVLVIEQEGSIVAMAENTLIEITAEDEPGFTPPGYYCCIDNVSVHQDSRRQGLGHLLLQGVADFIQPLQDSLHGYLLWYNPDNPSAARFWAQQGFRAMWTTYQRLHT